MNLRNLFVLVFFVGFLSACNNNDKPKEESKPVPSKLPAPFRYHEKVEVRPGLIFDVYSWGRGADSLASILILRSDSTNNFFTADNTEIEGKLIEVLNTDMDSDGNPELIIHTELNEKYKPAEIYCYEFSGKESNRIRFPDLTNKTKKQYRGKDKFNVKEGKLMREFSLFDENDLEGKKETGKKNVVYGLEGNSFTISEIEPK